MSATLHVGVDATGWSNNRGFGRFTRELVSALAARNGGFRYTLVMDRQPDQDLPSGIGAISAPTRRTLEASSAGTGSRSLGYVWTMGQLVRRAAFDLFFFPSVYAYFPILTRLPCVVCYHDATAERLPEFLFPTRLNHRLWQAKTALARLQTTRAMTVSRTSADDLERILGIARDRIDVVTEAASAAFRVAKDPTEHAEARARLGLPAAATLLVHVGGMNAHKNLRRLLEAMREVVSERPDVHLVLVGDTSGKGFWDDVPGLRRFVADHPPLGQHVHFPGRVDDGELAALLSGATALVFPSLWEGFGLPAVEAMSCGLPVLASDRGALPEVVGDAGCYFDPEDPAAIAACLLSFLRTPDLHARLSQLARQRARKFTWERAAERAEACFLRCHQDVARG